MGGLFSKIGEAVSDVATGGLKSIIGVASESISGVLDKFIESPEKKTAASLELQRILNEHEEKLVQLQHDREELIVRDTESARAMQIAALQQSDVFSKRFTAVFGAIYTACCFAFFFLLFYKPVPAENKDLINTITGALIISGALAINKFFFGTSKGNEDKNTVITNLSNQLKR